MARYRLMPRWSASPRQSTRTTFFYGCLFVAWAGIVIATSAYHEFMRDEVRALSYAMDSSSLSDLLKFMEDEGHPMLWHLLLYGSYHVVSSKAVLPAVSFLIAAAAVFLFIFSSPFPPWLKAMFVLGGLPLYEYSVMARNYGISMLLLFIFAWMYASRKRYPIAIGVILALLCNTNIHSLMLACLLMSLWVWDTFVKDRSSPFSADACALYVALALFAVSMTGALYTLWPTEDMIASDTTRYTTAHIFQAFAGTVRNPSGQFRELFPSFVPSALASAVLLASMSGLIVRPFILALACAAFCALSVFFSVFYLGGYRHQGLFAAFLVCLYWIVLESRQPLKHKSLQYVLLAGLYGGLPLLFAFLILSGAKKVYVDWVYQESASKAFQGFLRSHPEYTDAILIGEPDYLLEPVPYYAENRMYIVREKRFGKTIRFVRSAQLHLSMGELLCAAWHIQKQENKPVLIALGHLTVEKSSWESGPPLQSISYPFRRTFTWSREELADWRRYTALQRQFDQNVVGDEVYAVYSMTTPANGPRPCESAP